ncbi:MAG: Na/Pi cotransporter family protein [Gammaproteobacteria bacterium]|nr:Na/Pi cotransporter family protein [Gammaproteobacteria bacterium]
MPRFLVAVLCLCSLPVYAAVDVMSTAGAGQMAMQLVGGLALFLFGIDQMTDALKAVAGERMRTVLATLTANRFMGALTGAFATAIIQSSSVTTVLVVGFTTAGLMSFSQSIGVIMGANIGTTITAQIVAFKITKIALLMVAVGFAFLFFSKKDRLRHYGAIIMGVGLVFFGMSVMSEAMHPLRSYQPFLDLMIRMENPFVGILVAAGFTALIQSSSATTAIVIVMAGQGFITLPAGIALAFGANIGTCVTALLAAIGKPREAMRAAATHVFFNIAGVLIWLGLVDQLANVVTLISPSHGELSGVERLAAEAPRQIANAHTIFNVANTLIFIGFTTIIARFVEWLIPDKPLDVQRVIKAKYLDDAVLSTPSLALDLVRHEIAHMGVQVKEMLKGIMPAILSGSAATLKEIAEIDERVDFLHAEIVTYLGKISRLELTEKQTQDLVRLMDAVNDLENIGDVIEMNLVELGHRRIDKGVLVSSPTQVVLTDFHHAVLDSVEAAIRAVAEDSSEAAQSVKRMKKEIMRVTNSAAAHEARRLVADEPQRIEAYTIEMDIAEKLQRIYYFARRMARTVDAELPDEKLPAQSKPFTSTEGSANRRTGRPDP